ncbi:MAG TPA: hypothetical protein VEZ90_15455 [Blastocatellia bacterium]|nr:hypothetical protein [Blastocatellia bacterium]
MMLIRLLLVGICVAGYLFVWVRAKVIGSESARHTKKTYVQTVVAAGVIFGTLPLMYIAAGFFPSHVFKEAFGFSPTSDVVELSGYRDSLGDCEVIFLRFRASQTTVNQIVRGKFATIDRASFGDGTGIEGTPPKYWRPFDTHPTQFYRLIENYQSLSSALLCYDEESRVVHFSSWSK